MRVGACMSTSWMENIKPVSSLIAKPRCGEQGNALLIWLASAGTKLRLKKRKENKVMEFTMFMCTILLGCFIIAAAYVIKDK